MNFGRLSADKLGEIISSGGAKPSEAISAILENARSENRRLNCFITICEEYALAIADRIEKKISGNEPLGRLAGIPLAVKDNIITKDIATTCGSRILDGFVPPYNATAIDYILSEDAVIIGKTNMDEFGMGSSNENSYFGRVINPINDEYVPGGSSGGSACAVAAGLVPWALGSDTGGSVRQPASFCGIVGLKPTYGAISRYGLIAFGSSLDQIGILSRNVKDCALLFSIISRRDYRDETCMAAQYEYGADDIGQFERLKIGLPGEYFGEGIDPEVSRSVHGSIKLLEKLGCEIMEISLPNTDKAIAAYYIIANAEASSNLARYDGVRYGFRSEECKNLEGMYKLTRGRGFGDEVKRRIMLGTYALSSGYYDAYYLKAQKAREIIRRDFKRAFSEVDLIVTPTSPTPAFKLGEKIADPLAMYLSDVYTVSVNLAYLPAISIPCGKTSSGLPIGMQIIGDAFGERKIFKLAYGLEKELGFEF